MKGRWGTVIAVVVGLVGLAVVPFAGAGAQTTSTMPANEGSFPPGGTVNCTAGATLDPDSGPPGTLVNVTATFAGNCDDFGALDFPMECEGTVTGAAIEGLSFPVTVNDTSEPTLTGQFTAPAGNPDPPVIDAVEALAVSITCFIPDGSSPPAPTAEGAPTGTTYVFPPETFSLELFADLGEQPTLVDDDPDVGVVDGTPTFTG